MEPTRTPASRTTTAAPSFLVSALRAGVPFGVTMSIFFATRSGWSMGLPAGLLSGLAFGVVMAAFVKWQGGRLAIKGDQLDGERILFQGAANHWRGAESRGGWLVLTERALVFRAHGFNAQTAPLRVELSEVQTVAPCASLGIIPNGLRLELRDGKREQFVVNGRSEWARWIRERIAA
jgi:hypothetical protein